MVAKLIDGKAIAGALRQEITSAVTSLRQQHGIVPGLAVVLVGDNPASQVYVRNKEQAVHEVGMNSFPLLLPANTDQDTLLSHLARLNADGQVDGILVQLPLPAGLDANAALAAVDPAKDVDGFHFVNAGKLASGLPGLVPCTPQGCMILLKSVVHDFAGRHALVIGRSNIVGKPMAQLLLQADCTVTVAHSRSHNLPALCAAADIVVAAVGRPAMVRGTWLKPGTVVIDVGMNRIIAEGGKTRLIGDVAFEEALHVASAITPVPGGVGPMTIACLLRNTLLAACARHRVAPPAALAA